uniref:Uncharacterized protein n=1 Tax=Solanum lycopersicum TaxID=4081 RepID=A0A3Q7IG83_SOLLC
MSLNIPYKINPIGAIERIRELLKGYHSLILGFNAYLPNGYEIMLSYEEMTSLKNTTNYEEERNFVENIKVAVLFNDHHDLLDEFSEFLKYSDNPNPLSSLLLVLDSLFPCGYDIIFNDEVKPLKKSIHFKQVSVLLSERPDLVDEFSGFLPDLVTTNMLSNLDGTKN